MPHPYKHVFFDLDHTLWDFDRNSEETLTELFFEFELDRLLRIKVDSFLKSYGKVNRTMWSQYNTKSITKEQMREQRFSLVFRDFGIVNNELALRVNDEYLRICPTKPHLLPGTVELLDHVSKNYSCHIITNGFEETQYRKLKNSGLGNYFENVFTSESTGFTKPDRRIFHKALGTSNAKPGDSLMVGDNLSTDIRGAKSMKIDQVYCNFNGYYHKQSPTFEVQNLGELLQLFRTNFTIS